jgi:L-serine/L-threonine ammonia-lyase
MHILTPLIDWQSPSAVSGQRVRLKMECWQPVGSFKIRGIGHLAKSAVGAGATHLVASSGGNAGLAVAWAGRELDVPVTVVVPESTGERVRKLLAQMGAQVRVHGTVWDQADELARKLSGDSGSCYIPPFDHPLIWEGHSSLIVECAEHGPRPDLVVVSVGGGGLLCGVLSGLHQVGWEEVPVLAVETEGAASLQAAINAGGAVEIDAIDSVAKTLGALRVADEAFAWTQRHPVTSRLVSDRQAVSACLDFADDHRVLVEPACGAALAAVYDRQLEMADILVVVCGGAGVSLHDLRGWAEELGVDHTSPMAEQNREICT